MPSSHCNLHPRLDPSSEEEIVITMRSQSAGISVTATFPRAIIKDPDGVAYRSLCSLLATKLTEQLDASNN